MADPVMTIQRFRSLSQDRRNEVMVWVNRHFEGSHVVEVRWAEGRATIVERGGMDDPRGEYERPPVDVAQEPPWMGWED